MNTLHTLKLLVTLLVLTLLYGCGGGGGGGSSSPENANNNVDTPSVLTGYFVDSYVQGMFYRTSSGIEGITTQEGAFNYSPDDEISFYVGNMALGTFGAKELITVLEAENPGQLAAFLQAIDNDNNPENGIEITESMAEKFSQSNIVLEEVSAQDSNFKTKFEQVTGKAYKVDEQAALNHAVVSARLALIKDTDLYNYYVGNINVDSNLLNKELLNENARARVELYVFSEFITPRLQTKAYLLNAENMDISKVAENNKKIASDIAKYTSAVITTAASTASPLSIKDGSDLKNEATNKLREALSEKLTEVSLEYFEDKSPLLGGIAARALPIIDTCMSAYKGKEIIDKAESYANCALSTANLAFAGFTDGFSAYKLASSVEKFNSLIVAQAYLEAYYRNARNIRAVELFYNMGTETKPSLRTFKWRIEHIAQEVLPEENSFFGFFGSTDGTKKLNYSFKAVEDLVIRYRKEVDEHTAFFMDKFGLDSNKKAGFAVDSSDFNAYFVDGAAKIVDENTINLCFILENKQHIATLPINIEILNVENNAVLWSESGFEVSTREHKRICREIVHGQDTSLDQDMVFQLNATHTVSQAVKSNTLIVSPFFASDYVQDQLKSMTVPYFDLEVATEGSNIPEQGLEYGVNYFTVSVNANDLFNLQQDVTDATFSWQELYPSQPHALEVIQNTQNKPTAYFKFSPLTAQEEVRVYYVQLTITNPRSKVTRQAEIKVVIENSVMHPDNTNLPPIVSITLNSAMEYTAGEKVFLTANAIDPDGTIVQTEWKPLFTNLPQVVNAGSLSQAYIITPAEDKTLAYSLTVTDNGGITTTKQVTIKVKGAEDPIVEPPVVEPPVVEPPQPKVTRIEPLSTNINTLTTFRVEGENFPDTMAAHVQGADCPAELKQRVSATLFTLQCQHNVAETLMFTAVEQSGGALLGGGEISIQFNALNVSNLPVVDGFDYPIGHKGYDTNNRITPLLEQITDETNPYSNSTGISVTNNHSRQATAFDATQWRNTNDVGSFLAEMGGLHPGEDWNLGSGNDDAGQPVYAVADGQVILIQSTYQNGKDGKLPHERGAWTLALKHKLNEQGDVIYSLYTHITAGNQTQGNVVTSASDFPINVGVDKTVKKGDIIARIAHGEQMSALSSAHLHFEMRTTEPSTVDLWPDDNSNGYYSHNNSKLLGNISASEVLTTFAKMKNVGIIDPSDYIDHNRVAPHLLANTRVTEVLHPTLIAGQQATFTIVGEFLPPTLAISLHGAICGVPYDMTATQAKIDCTVSVTASPNDRLALYIKAYSGGPFLVGAEGQQVVIGQLPEPPPVASGTGKLNDTGITWGGNYPGGNNADCTGETIGEQDCSHGRDALAAAGQLSKMGGGMAGFDFTKLDANGNPLPNQNQDYATQPWACVKDNHTGLIWEVKTPDAQGTHLHSMNDAFNWYNTNPATNGGSNGFADDDGAVCTGYNAADPSTYCNTQDFVNRVNSSNGGAGLCGATDWRMPNLHELKSIVHFGKFNPAIDENYFPNSGSGFYWSSSPFADDSNSAWVLHFINGGDSDALRSYSNRVRLVHSGQ